MSIDFQGIRQSHPIADTVGRYIELKRQGGEYRARCPFHNDGNPSFYVVPKKDKAFCMSCGWHGDVVDFIAEFESVDTVEAARRLNGGELPDERPALPPVTNDEDGEWRAVLPAPDDAPAYDPAKTYNPRRGRVVNWKRSLARCDAYRDAAGRILGYVVRLEVDGQKLTPTVVWARHADGRECWASVKFPSPRPLQGLDDLARRPDAAVLVVSGEKCREAAAATFPGFVAVTWPGGDHNVLRANWQPLNGRRVTIWPDADASGMDAAQKLAQALYGHAAEVRVIDPSGQPKGWDVADALADGMTRASLIEWIKPRVSTWRPDEPDPEPTKRVNGHHVELPNATTQRAIEDSYAGRVETAQSVDDLIPNEPAVDPPVYADELEAYYGDQSAPAMVERTPAATRAAAVELDTLDPNEDDLPDRYTEDNVALAFSAKHADEYRYVAPWGRWMRWHEQRWVADETILVFDEARKLCRQAADHARNDQELTASKRAAVAAKFGASNTVASVERFARADRRHAATVSQWDADPWLLNTPAGVVDLRTGSLAPGSRLAYMTKITRVAPGGACEAWHRFLHTATAGDTELIAFLQRMAGYCLTGSTRDHALFFVYGTGGNGKGTFLNTLQWIIGDYAKSAPADMFTERKHEAHSTELARLMGARLVAAQETEEGKRWAEAKIKALTGGDPVTARFMRQDDFEFIPQFKLVMTGNHKPGLRNVDEAIKRRLHLIPFTVTIAPQDRDQTLPERLKAESGGILQWAIEGCMAWQRDGLRPPAAVVAATDEYLEQQDVLGAWIEECCDVGANYSARRGDLYRSFKAWAERSGEYVLPQKRWVAAIETRGIKTRTLKGVQRCDGLAVKTEQSQGGWGYEYDDA